MLGGRNEEAVAEELRPDDTRTWLEMLFRPGEIFESRVKTNEERGAKQIWLPYERIEDFVATHVPIHAGHKRHIWIGIAPRPKVGSTSPTVHRALWCDFSAAVTSVDQARDAIQQAGIPPATMLVWSGNGVHGYWLLKQPVRPEDAKPYVKGIHEALPTDATHDSSRIMRVPGTLNTKDPAHPSACYIAEHDPERVYELLDFPKAQVTRGATQTGARPAQMRPLSAEDRELFVSRWLPGERHQLVMGVAGYLRKQLYYDEESAVAEITRIHREAGYEPDDNLVKTVKDTYEQLWAKVSGLRILEEKGIVPQVRDHFEFTFKKKPKKKPRIEVIDFEETIEDQEFWMDGLIGPGMLTLWAAEPKTGKSFAAMQIGHALATGSPLWDFPGTGRKLRVLYFQGELSKGMVYARQKSLFGESAIKDPRRYALTAKPPEPIDLVQSPEALTDLADEFDVVIVDPISVFISSDEAKSYAVNEVVGVFDRLRDQGKAVLLVHHTRKLQSERDGTPIAPTMSDIRGSGAWFATADAIALHYRTGKAGNTEVKFEFRAAPPRDNLPLYRMPEGGFTADKTAYLKTQGNLQVHLDS